jgi:UDP-N-acetylglucosamine transferase subunit ALG13
MILVATGTTGFDHLARAMDRLAPALGEAVVIQIGAGQYVPQHTEYFRFAPSLAPYYAAAALVVAHGGLGVCLEALQAGKRLIAVSNPDRHDQHQQDLLSMLAADNYLIWCRDIDRLDQAITTGRQIALRPYHQPECSLHLRLREYLAGLDAARSEPQGLGKPPLWRRIRFTRGDPR